MLIALGVGMLSGAVGVACWWLAQLALSLPRVISAVAGNPWVVPPVLGCVAAAAHAMADGLRPGRPDRRVALADLFESYHFASFVLSPLHWIVRGAVTLLNAFLGGTFGVEGGVLELTYASLPVFSRAMRLFVEERQTFVICALSASLGTAFGAPFSAGLIALELVRALEARVRAGAVTAALASYGTAMVLQSSLSSTFFADEATERHTVLGSLFAGSKTSNFDLTQWFLLSAAAACVGVAAAALAAANSRALAGGTEAFAQLFRRRLRLGMIAAGLLMGLAAWLVPESFGETWRAWEDMAWLRLSSRGALTLLAGQWALLILAFSGWGSAGLFSPVLQLGALLGYVLGNAVGSSWSVPMAIAGGAACLSASFRLPISAVALVLETGHDVRLWWLSILAVIGAEAFRRLFHVEPLHERLLSRHGIRLVGGRAASLLALLRTGDAMYRDIRTIPDHADLSELRQAAISSQHNFLGVVSMDGRYLGLLALEQLPGRIRRVLRRDASTTDFQAVERVLDVRQLIDGFSPTVLPTESCEKALSLLQSSPCVAVVDEERRLRGLLFESSIAGRYKREIANVLIRRPDDE